MRNLQQSQLNTAFNRLLAADSDRDLVDAPGAGYRLGITMVAWNSIVAAAQVVTLRSTDGSVVVFELGASIPVGTGNSVRFEKPVFLPTNQAFSAVPASAGPRIAFAVEYVKEIV